jgi:hypothetical protein
MKHIFDRDLGEYLPHLVQLFRDLARQESGLELLYTLLRYMTGTGQRVTEASVWRLVHSVVPEEGEAIMSTLAEKWVEQGLEQGRQEGRQEGLLEGAHMGQNTILAILRTRFSGSGADVEAIAQKLAQVTDLPRLEALPFAMTTTD